MAYVPPSTSTTKTWSQYPDPSIFPEHAIVLDVALLTALCSIQGKSGDEGDMQAFILAFLEAHGLTPHSDANGNITCTKGEADAYPCMVAHMDTVHSSYIGYEATLSDDGQVLYAYAPTVPKYEPSVTKDNLSRIFTGAVTKESGNVQCGVGGDDRCGIYVALHLLTRLPAMKVAFFVEEECGGAKGSGFAAMDFFSDTAVVLQCDRKGHDDWVQTVSGTQVSSNEFIDGIKDLLTLHKYTVTQGGGFTDVGQLKSRGLGVCAANMSCGYYSPHTSSETIFLPALTNTLNLCAQVLERVGYVKQLHEYKRHTPSTGNYGSNYSQHNSRWGGRQHTTYKEHKADRFGKGFSCHDFGWGWLSAKELADQHQLQGLAIGGFTKLVEGKLVGPLQWDQVKDYEREQAENKELEAANEQARLAKEARKALKAWIEKDGTWVHNKLKGPKSSWVKWISDGGEKDAFYPVAYAKAMLDIPEVEKEFQFQWEGCYGAEATGSVAPGEEGMTFSAETISRFIHKELEEKAAALAQKEARSIANQHQLPFADGSTEAVGAYKEVSYETRRGVEYMTTKEYTNGKLVATIIQTVANKSSQPEDDATVRCPDCNTKCVAPHPTNNTGDYFFCDNCQAWQQEEIQDADVDDTDEDVYSRWLSRGSEHGNWRDQQSAYEQAYSGMD